MKRSPETLPPRPSYRWWPAIVISGVTATLLAAVWLRDAGHTQDKVVTSYKVAFAGIVALLFWSVLWSRLPGRTRLAIFLSVAAFVGLGFLTLELKGVSGDIVPVVGFRWSGERAFDDVSSQGTAKTEISGTGIAGVDDPGPGDYPQLYGPNRDATLPGPRLARDWKTRPPKLLWRRQVGEGWSSFAVAGDAAITQEQRG